MKKSVAIFLIQKAGHPHKDLISMMIQKLLNSISSKNEALEEKKVHHIVAQTSKMKRLFDRAVKNNKT